MPITNKIKVQRADAEGGTSMKGILIGFLFNLFLITKSLSSPAPYLLRYISVFYCLFLDSIHGYL
jgi:hypothetical protein